jgi:hypothetical protein
VAIDRRWATINVRDVPSFVSATAVRRADCGSEHRDRPSIRCAADLDRGLDVGGGDELLRVDDARAAARHRSARPSRPWGAAGRPSCRARCAGRAARPSRRRSRQFTTATASGVSLRTSGGRPVREGFSARNDHLGRNRARSKR